MVRLISASTQPPKKPATMPSVVPMMTESIADRNAMSSEMRAP